MTPPRNYNNLLEEYIDRQQGMWMWIALDPLNRTCKDYHKKFTPHINTLIDNFACDYADKVSANGYDRCENCFLDSNFQKCAELMSQFSTAVHNKDEDNAARIAWKIGKMGLRKEYR